MNPHHVLPCRRDYIQARSAVPEGTRGNYKRLPRTEPALSAVEGCWATIVTPFGLKIDGSHPFAKAAKGWAPTVLFVGTEKGWATRTNFIRYW
jgi:hypothetical protein